MSRRTNVSSVTAWMMDLITNLRLGSKNGTLARNMNLAALTSQNLYRRPAVAKEPSYEVGMYPGFHCMATEILCATAPSSQQAIIYERARVGENFVLYS